MKVKICGITNIDDALNAQLYGADAIGFIFYKNSKRYITEEEAGKISASLSPFLLKIGVFINEKIERINAAVKAARLNAVQLYEDGLSVSNTQLNVPVIRGFRVDDDFDFGQISNYTETAILLDSYSKKKYGGTGKIFNWSKIPSDLRKRIILSGGISSSNIEKVYNEIKPAAVDLSSSLESSPGKKDTEKIKEFFKILNNLRGKNKWSSL